MKSITLSCFWECYRRLPEAIRREAREAYQIFAANPLHPGLRFHRLSNDPRCWSVRVTRDYRAVGILDGNTITWIWIGSHEEFDRAFPK